MGRAERRQVCDYLRQLHPTKAQRDATIGFGAVEYGYQTPEKLARHVDRLGGAFLVAHSEQRTSALPLFELLPVPVNLRRQREMTGSHPHDCSVRRRHIIRPLHKIA